MDKGRNPLFIGSRILTEECWDIYREVFRRNPLFIGSHILTCCECKVGLAKVKVAIPFSSGLIFSLHPL